MSRTGSLPRDGTATLAVTHRAFTHHGRYSGYNRVLQELGVPVVDVHPDRTRARRVLEAWRVARGAAARGWQQVHLYPEQSLPFPGLAVDPQRTAVVVHQSPEMYLSHPRGRLFVRTLRRVGLVIALGQTQRNWLSAQGVNAVFVPHGVDTAWFQPAAKAAGARARTFVTVPGWQRRPVVHDQVMELGGGRLDDQRYRDGLRGSAGLVLDLPQGVASNAVLEACACGLPVLGRLSTDTASYVAPENRRLLELTLPDQLAAPPDELRRVGEANRAYVAASFRWSDVGGRLREVLAVGGDRC